MANEKRLIDANAIHYEEHYVPNGEIDWVYKKELCVLKPTIDAMPTVDAVEVVRCKDCRSCYYNSINEMGQCRKSGEVVWKDHFCSYGERKEDG